jgi:hypothetical protein
MDLTTVEGGISRLRTRGRASPDVLYDLLNGYVTADGTVKSRPGTFRVAELPPGSVGLTAHGGKLHVFRGSPASGPAEPPDGPEGLILEAEYDVTVASITGGFGFGIFSGGAITPDEPLFDSEIRELKSFTSGGHTLYMHPQSVAVPPNAFHTLRVFTAEDFSSWIDFLWAEADWIDSTVGEFYIDWDSGEAWTAAHVGQTLRVQIWRSP